MTGLIALQRQVGNAATTRLVRQLAVQRLDAGDADKAVQWGTRTVHDVLEAVEPPEVRNGIVEAVVAATRAMPSSTPVDEKLIRHYADGQGRPLVLSVEDMQQCKPLINVFQAGFPDIFRVAKEGYAAAQAGKVSGQRVVPVDGVGLGESVSRAGLGSFTVHLWGTVTTSPGADRPHTVYSGTCTFNDYWDFDPKPYESIAGRTHRSFGGEALTDTMGMYLPGKPFKVLSVVAPFTQANPEDPWGHVGGP
jgi:hypothetical protein